MIKIETTFSNKSTQISADGKGYELLLESGTIILALVDLHMRHSGGSMEAAEKMVMAAYRTIKDSTEKMISVDETAFRKDEEE
ncbi:MAG: hypothetical protein Q4A15_06415 [Prevotellaceae bacterium]|nr:hypothetical protein [Prevotellaceae bacterium]